MSIKDLLTKQKEQMKQDAKKFSKEFKRKEDADHTIDNWSEIKATIEAHLLKQCTNKNISQRRFYLDDQGCVLTLLVTPEKERSEPKANNNGNGYNWWLRSPLLEEDLMCFADENDLYGNFGVGIWVRGWISQKYKQLGDSVNAMFPSAFHAQYGKWPNEMDASEIEVVYTINIWQLLEVVG